MKRELCFVGVMLIVSVLLPGVAQAVTLPFINEIHYDNVGGDLDEGVEIAGPAGTDLSGWGLVLYNGSTGLAYDSLLLSGSIVNQQNSYGALWFPWGGLQNGSPDGVTLVDSANTLVQFLSYEGSFMAIDGPAAGTASIDIRIREDGPVPPVGYSLQLTGLGSDYSDFTWSGPIASTPGAVNTGQNFISGVTAVPEPATFSILGLGLLCLAGKSFKSRGGRK